MMTFESMFAMFVVFALLPILDRAAISADESEIFSSFTRRYYLHTTDYYYLRSPFPHPIGFSPFLDQVDNLTMSYEKGIV